MAGRQARQVTTELKIVWPLKDYPVLIRHDVHAGT